MWREARLDCEAMAFSRGERPLAAGISLSLTAGDAVALVGPNGSGKTSLLRILAGLAEPQAGRIALSVCDVAADVPRSALCHLGGHADGLKGALTVEQNLAFWIAYFGRPPQSPTIAEALDRLGIGHVIGLPAGILSQGQKRRVALARLLVAPRPIWLLDEPTAALDDASVERFMALAAAHRAAGGIVVFATHSALPMDGLKTLDLADYPPKLPASFGSAKADGRRGASEDYWLDGGGS
ncbi:MAG: heme ABC exporter ATP-binding protein CcmA [Pseudomonadota bacterium]